MDSLLYSPLYYSDTDENKTTTTTTTQTSTPTNPAPSNTEISTTVVYLSRTDSRDDISSLGSKDTQTEDIFHELSKEIINLDRNDAMVPHEMSELLSGTLTEMAHASYKAIQDSSAFRRLQTLKNQVQENLPKSLDPQKFLQVEGHFDVSIKEDKDEKIKILQQKVKDLETQLSELQPPNPTTPIPQKPSIYTPSSTDDSQEVTMSDNDSGSKESEYDDPESSGPKEKGAGQPDNYSPFGNAGDAYQDTKKEQVHTTVFINKFVMAAYIIVPLFGAAYAAKLLYPSFKQWMSNI